MDTIGLLNKEFSRQDFPETQHRTEMLDKYKDIARNYALMENNIAVLSDLRTQTSHIYYGGFSRMLGMEKCGEEHTVASVWEEDIFKLIHPDDLAGKHLQELSFYHFIKRQPKKRRTAYYLMCKLRMRTRSNGYIDTLHRMFYIHSVYNDSLWLALCLYSPLAFDIPAKCLIIYSVNGQMTKLNKHSGTKILSNREKQVLSLIDKGFTSKEISFTLSISINTVSRHRQEILGKLQVKNSIEACRTAKDLNLI